MDTRTPSYRAHRYPAEIIRHAVWLYYRFCLSFRDVEDLLAERGVTVSYETIRKWCRKFGGEYARRLRRREGRLGEQRERQMRRFKSPGQAQRFLFVHASIQNLFCVGRHLVSAGNHRVLRERSFLVWRQETCAC